MKAETTSSPARRKSLAEVVEARVSATANEIQDPTGGADDTQVRLEKLLGRDNVEVVLPIDLVDISHNVRLDFDTANPDDLSLVESIRDKGVLQSPLVTLVRNDEGFLSVKCLAGHRRIVAAKVAGLESIACKVRKFSDGSEHVIVALIENIQRKELHPLDLAECYFKLDLEGFDREYLERFFDKSRTTVLRALKIAKWDDRTKDVIRKDRERFTGRFLNHLASKKLTNDQVHAAVLQHAGISKLSTGNRTTRNLEAVKRVESYMANLTLPQEVQDAVMKVLTDLKLIGRVRV